MEQVLCLSTLKSRSSQAAQLHRSHGGFLGMIMHSIERLYNCRVGGDLQASFKSKLFLMKLPKDGRVGGRERRDVYRMVF